MTQLTALQDIRKKIKTELRKNSDVLETQRGDSDKFKYSLGSNIAFRTVYGALQVIPDLQSTSDKKHALKALKVSAIKYIENLSDKTQIEIGAIDAMTEVIAMIDEEAKEKA